MNNKKVFSARIGISLIRLLPFYGPLLKCYSPRAFYAIGILMSTSKKLGVILTLLRMVKDKLNYEIETGMFKKLPLIYRFSFQTRIRA